MFLVFYCKDIEGFVAELRTIIIKVLSDPELQRSGSFLPSKLMAGECAPLFFYTPVSPPARFLPRLSLLPSTVCNIQSRCFHRVGLCPLNLPDLVFGQWLLIALHAIICSFTCKTSQSIDIRTLTHISLSYFS